MKFKVGDKVQMGKSKTVWIIVELNAFSQVAKVTSGKRNTMQYLDRLTKV